MNVHQIYAQSLCKKLYSAFRGCSSRLCKTQPGIPDCACIRDVRKINPRLGLSPGLRLVQCTLYCYSSCIPFRRKRSWCVRVKLFPSLKASCQSRKQQLTTKHVFFENSQEICRSPRTFCIRCRPRRSAATSWSAWSRTRTRTSWTSSAPDATKLRPSSAMPRASSCAPVAPRSCASPRAERPDWPRVARSARSPTKRWPRVRSSPDFPTRENLPLHSVSFCTFFF